MLIDQAIFKVGGKIFENRKNLISTISQLTSLYERNIIHKIVLIAGGGSYANFIRRLDQKFSIGDDISHWMAIYSMDLNGKKISRYFPRVKRTKNLEEIKKANKIFTIFLPYKFLRQNDILDHSWNISSDSIALYLAYKLNMKICFLIKNVDGIIDRNNKVIKELSSKEYIRLKNLGKLADFSSKEDSLKLSKPIDSYLPDLINKYQIDCVLLNGTSSNLRIMKYFKINNSQNKIYSKISHC
ncbi:MAG: hypothetical protein EAX89_05095 [Candidatus Lokiarchaeota archaeon]|nr:hypothetical protein [Candidatus Lokiarchaeota archaeon]